MREKGGLNKGKKILVAHAQEKKNLWLFARTGSYVSDGSGCFCFVSVALVSQKVKLREG